jgi:hypothetical protein
MPDFDKLVVNPRRSLDVLGKNQSRRDFASPARRRIAVSLIGVALILPFSARGQRVASKGTVLNVVMYSALDRPIHDIIFNGTDLGVANKYGGTGAITGVRIPFGIQTLTWSLGGPEGMARNGELVTVKNKIVISPEQIPAGTRYLGLNLYPDDTAEVTFAEFIPERSARGKEIRARRSKNE